MTSSYSADTPKLKNLGILLDGLPYEDQGYYLASAVAQAIFYKTQPEIEAKVNGENILYSN
jgi:hypothetical protein